MREEYTKHGIALCKKFERAMYMKVIMGPKRYEIYRGVLWALHKQRIILAMGKNGTYNRQEMIDFTEDPVDLLTNGPRFDLAKCGY